MLLAAYWTVIPLLPAAMITLAVVRGIRGVVRDRQEDRRGLGGLSMDYLSTAERELLYGGQAGLMKFKPDPEMMKALGWHDVMSEGHRPAAAMPRAEIRECPQAGPI